MSLLKSLRDNARMVRCFVLLVVILVSVVVAAESSKEGKPKEDAKAAEKRTEAQKGVKYAPCKACNHLVSSFQKGLERTARGKFEGGDAAWEEKKQVSYARSEVRLVEIQEELCNENPTAQHQCHDLAAEHESLLEEWWREVGPEAADGDLQKWLCVEQLKVCCPRDHYGAECSPCPGIEKGGAPCGGNGVCKGAGTRKGSGKCECAPGYSGELCRECTRGHFMAYEDDSKTLCSACHQSCSASSSDPQGTICTGPGPKSCSECKPGWILDAERGCIDVDECLSPGQNGEGPCEKDQFCANEEGSYKCLACDSGCDGCTGDGPDMCLACKPGFDEEDGICVGKKQDKEELNLTWGRYVTYFGLCIATFIIFQRNVFIAGIVGMLVAIYVSVSEYWLRTLHL